MGSQRRAKFLGTGSYLPATVLDNNGLEKLVSTSDEWIRERTGIRERRVASQDESTSTMATEAARRACDDANIDPADLDLIIVATITGDYRFPATACLVQHAIGAKNAAAFDLQAACTGFLYAVTVANGLITAGTYRNVLVIGAETLTRCIDYTDRGTCILFGDGAGAAVLSPTQNGVGVLYDHIASDGGQAELIYIPAGGSKLPASLATVTAGEHYIHMEGKQIYRFATEKFASLIERAMRECALTPNDVALVVPHQVNLRIIESAMRRLDMPLEKCFINLHMYGNTSAASVPIALDEARQQGQVKSGDTVILLGFGAGLTWGVTVVRF